ncbi:uncharacterized protein SCODWIG_03288 [Saccharomycodes ludwigii]|uniref:Uncharacterized protein n=1 Tax=Saccharomycodes ludwigii TaxID=36035 RepID=A0A376BA45_9ASCO|nr:uncharacterized protein SCODWIG_03288 [Saccharomycodes ludwigii]
MTKKKKSPTNNFNSAGANKLISDNFNTPQKINVREPNTDHLLHKLLETLFFTNVGLDIVDRLNKYTKCQQKPSVINTTFLHWTNTNSFTYRRLVVLTNYHNELNSFIQNFWVTHHKSILCCIFQFFFNTISPLSVPSLNSYINTYQNQLIEIIFDNMDENIDSSYAKDLQCLKDHLTTIYLNKVEKKEPKEDHDQLYNPIMDFFITIYDPILKKKIFNNDTNAIKSKLKECLESFLRSGIFNPYETSVTHQESKLILKTYATFLNNVYDGDENDGIKLDIINILKNRFTDFKGKFLKYPDFNNKNGNNEEGEGEEDDDDNGDDDYDYELEKDISYDPNNALSINTDDVDETFESLGDEKQHPNDEYDDEYIYQFDITNDGELKPMVSPCKRHNIIAALLTSGLVNIPYMRKYIINISALVDPVTQPPPNDKHVISIDLLSNMFVASIYPEGSVNKPINFDIWRFEVCFTLSLIIKQLLKLLKLSEINEDIDNTDKHWKSHLNEWCPTYFNTQDLELLYMIGILSTYTIYQLYNVAEEPENNDGGYPPIQLNPFSLQFLEVWYRLTVCIMLGLELDRYEEEVETYNTPLVVKACIRGTSAWRSCLASVLNGFLPTQHVHDFKHEPFNFFMSPHGRKLSMGALYCDLKTFGSCTTLLGNQEDSEFLGELLFRITLDDRFDEDVKYMFDSEFDDYNEDTEDSVEGDEFEFIGYYKRCDCIFDDEGFSLNNPDEDEDDIDNDDELDIENIKLTANIRSSNNNFKNDRTEIDFNGTDWRDIVRGSNFYYTPDYQFSRDLKVKDKMQKLLVKASSESLVAKEDITFILKTLATAIKREQEEHVLRTSLCLDGVIDHTKTEEEFLSKYVFDFWNDNPDNFSKMLAHNDKLTYRMLDEMFMCAGYRRTLIWFLTHFELNFIILKYIYQLSIGMRGLPLLPQQQRERKQQESETKSKNKDEIFSTAVIAKNNACDNEQDAKNNLDSDKAENVRRIVNDNDTATPDNTEVDKEFTKMEAALLPNLDISNDDVEELYPFSRQGSVNLSELELKMLICELITSGTKFFNLALSSWVDEYEIGEINDEDDAAKEFHSMASTFMNLMKVICVMLWGWLNKDLIDFHDTKSTACFWEFNTVLIQFFGVCPQAHTIFFKLKLKLLTSQMEVAVDYSNEKIVDNIMKTGWYYDQELVEDDDDDDDNNNNNNNNNKRKNMRKDGKKSSDTFEKEHIVNLSKYDALLMNLVPEGTSKKLWEHYVKKHSVSKHPNIHGRKIVFRGTKIKPLKTVTDRPIKDFI